MLQRIVTNRSPGLRGTGWYLEWAPQHCGLSHGSAHIPSSSRRQAIDTLKATSYGGGSRKPGLHTFTAVLQGEEVHCRQAPVSTWDVLQGHSERVLWAPNPSLQHCPAGRNEKQRGNHREQWWEAGPAFREVLFLLGLQGPHPSPALGSKRGNPEWLGGERLWEQHTNIFCPLFIQLTQRPSFQTHRGHWGVVFFVILSLGNSDL